MGVGVREMIRRYRKFDAHVEPAIRIAATRHAPASRLDPVDDRGLRVDTPIP